VAEILIFSLNYAPEATGFAPHTTALAEHLVKMGHQVTVVTGFPFAPRWARFARYRGELMRQETINAVHLVRVTHFIPRRPGSAVQRMLMEGSFAAAAGVRMLLSRLFGRRRYDLVVYVGAQPAIAWLTRIVATMIRVPYIVKITDLAAQAAVDVGIVGGGLANVLNRIEFAAYRRARAAIVLCDAFKRALRSQGFADDAVHVSDPAFEGGDAHANAHVLAEAVRLLGADLILGGKQGIDDDSAYTCAAAAEHLGIPQALVVTELTVSDDRTRATARRRVEGADEIVEMTLPAMVTCEKGLNEPRYASLPGIMKAKKKEIRKIGLGELPLKPEQVGAAGSLARMVKYHSLPERPPVKMIPK
jgi:glycosyltransferase involved in cell wall biosynthesis